MHVFAPGSNILSTVPMADCRSASGCYDVKSGTSMAAPVVAGQALLLMVCFGRVLGVFWACFGGSAVHPLEGCFVRINSTDCTR